MEVINKENLKKIAEILLSKRKKINEYVDFLADVNLDLRNVVQSVKSVLEKVFDNVENKCVIKRKIINVFTGDLSSTSYDNSYSLSISNCTLQNVASKII